MKFSLIFIAALVAAVTARDFPCDDNREVGVCCINEKDAFEQCTQPTRHDNGPGDDHDGDHDRDHDNGDRTNHHPRQDHHRYTYTCDESRHAKCCDNHDNFKPRGLVDRQGSRRNCHDG